ncbi:MAG: serine hydrolase [Planctomycetota bacterium]
MKVKLFVATVAASGLVVGSARAQVDFSPVTDPIDAFLAARPQAPGAGLLIAGFDGTIVHEQYWGTYDRSTSIRIASATKWLSGTLLADLADEELLNLDAPLSTILPEFAGFDDGRGDTTVRQLFSHTSGMAGQSQWVGRQDVTLAQAVSNIAASPFLMTSDPGSTFSYGGVSMHVAGRVAEVVSGESWVDLFDERLANLLGMTSLSWDGIGGPTNPRIAGGAAASIDDYARLLALLGNGGMHDGERLLSQQAVDEILADQSGDVAIGFVPGGVDVFDGYGLGTWIERRNDAGQPVEFSSPGAFGAVPWIDIENEYYGIFLIDNSYQAVDDLTDALRAFSADVINAAPDRAGDADRDGDVDLADFGILRASFGTFPGRFVEGDLDGDTDVDLSDFAILRANFGQAEAALLDAWHASVVPEPTTILSLSTLLLTRRTGAVVRRGQP